MKFSTTGDPQELQNTGFGDYTMMGYTFEFVDKFGNKYFITDGVELCAFELGTDVILRFKVKWNQNMGILKDDKWGGKAKVAIYGKTPSDFVYKVANADGYFEIKLNGDQEFLYRRDLRNISEGEKKITKFCIT